MAYARGNGDGCGCGCNGDDCEEHKGLGYAAEVATVALEVGSQIFGGKDRHAGAFCCATDKARGPWPAGFDPEGTYPRNAGVDGAPPDYRARSDPWLQPSRHGFTRLKDDYCNCYPIPYGGRWWVLGEVRDGAVYVGPPENIEQGLFVEIDRNGVPLSVPGYGDITAPEEGTSEPAGGGGGTITQPSEGEPSGGGGAGGAPADGGEYWDPPYPPSGPEPEWGSGGFMPPEAQTPAAPAPEPAPWTEALRSPWVLGGIAVGAALLLRGK